MTTYKAPLRDMQFVMQDLLNFEKHYQSLPACDELNQELIDANFQLMPELGDKLRTLQVIESAHRQVDDEKATSHDGLNVRCPECHNPMAVSDDTPVSDLV